jgi:hypothetical protein
MPRQFSRARNPADPARIMAGQDSYHTKRG